MTDGLKIVFTHPCKVDLLPAQWPETVPDGQVMVKTAISTISPGTERAVLTDSPNCGGYTHHIFPRQSGYSSAGTVVAIGKGVTSVRPGDRVIVYWGTHSAYNVVAEKQAVKIPDGISFEEAAVVVIYTISLGALRKFRVEIGESALVMGCGLLGQFAVKLLHAAGAAPIIAADPVLARREEALRNGADDAFDPKEKNFAENVKDITGKGANVVIEVTGVGAGLDEALDCTARFGRVALLGCTRNSDFSIDYYHKIHTPGITLVGAHTMARPEEESSAGWFTQRDDMMAVLRLLKTGRISYREMLPEVLYSPKQCAEAYDHIMHDRSFPTVAQFDWRKLS